MTNALAPSVARLPNTTVMYPTLPPMPKAARPGAAKEQFSVEAVLIEGSPAHKAAVAAQEAAIKEKWPNGAPANLRRAIKDPEAPSQTRADGGPSRRGAVFENTDGLGKRWYLRAASQYDVQTLIGKEKRVPTVDDIYSGGVWLLVVKFAGYSAPSTGAGVTCYLQLAWRTSAGTPIAGGSTAVDADALVGDDVQFDDDIFG